MTQPPGELERKIKRAYEREETPRRARAKKRMSVAGVQWALCAVALLALAALRFLSPESFEALRAAYFEMFEGPEVLTLEAAASALRETIAGIIP